MGLKDVTEVALKYLYQTGQEERWERMISWYSDRYCTPGRKEYKPQPVVEGPSVMAKLEFRKEIPKVDGYYWYIDLEYPVPVIGYIAMGRFYNRHNSDDTAHVAKHYRIGPRIAEPQLSEITYEP